MGVVRAKARHTNCFCACLRCGARSKKWVWFVRGKQIAFALVFAVEQGKGNGCGSCKCEANKLLLRLSSMWIKFKEMGVVRARHTNCFCACLRCGARQRKWVWFVQMRGTQIASSLWSKAKELGVVRRATQIAF